MLEEFLREQAKKLHEKDEPAQTRDEWEKRRSALRAKIFAAIGEFPAKPCDLEPRVIDTLKRDGYTIQKLIFQSRPDVWVTATTYVPESKEKVPAVLVVHGHWSWARRDPVVQSRCVGLAKLGFFVMAVDAFGAGERYTAPARGTYHGALYGSTLWPVGQSLLGMQVYDNQRAVDYLLSRPEVNGKLGITGASGGGNQSMNAGALEERFSAVVPVCSVGNYQAYLKTACCVCEVLPSALQFTEEGDLLGLTAPRALLVINASRDGIQFSPAEAAKSLARAKEIYKLMGVEGKVEHKIFESGHDYSQPMRETMYGWMTLHLKGEGKGEPIPEPKLTLEKPEDLSCFPDPSARPKGFLFPPTFAAAVGKELAAKADKLVPDHQEMWDATAIGLRKELTRTLGKLPKLPKQPEGPFVGSSSGQMSTTAFEVIPEEGIKLAGSIGALARREKDDGYCLVLQYDDHPNPKEPGALREMILKRGAAIARVPLRGTAANKPASGIGGAPDHNLAEYGVWLGRSLLSQWVIDVRAIFSHPLVQDKNGRKILVGIGPMALPALIASALIPDVADATILIDPPASFISETGYAPGTPMGILAPGILKVGDIPHLTSLIAPRRLIIAGGTALNGKKLSEKELKEAFDFTSKVYSANKAAGRLTITTEANWEKMEM